MNEKGGCETQCWNPQFVMVGGGEKTGAHEGLPSKQEVEKRNQREAVRGPTGD